MPKVIQAQLTLSRQFDVQQDTTDIANRVLFYQEEVNNDRIHKDALDYIYSRAPRIASYSATPWGIGGVGAICAPFVAAMDAWATRTSVASLKSRIG